MVPVSHDLIHSDLISKRIPVASECVCVPFLQLSVTQAEEPAAPNGELLENLAEDNGADDGSGHRTHSGVAATSACPPPVRATFIKVLPKGQCKGAFHS